MKTMILWLALAADLARGDDVVADGRRLAACEGTCCNSATWRFDGKQRKDCNWVAEKQRRCQKETDGVPATVACPVACNTCGLANQIVDLEKELASAEEALDNATACPEEQPGWLFSQIAPRCTLDLDNGTLTMVFPTWGLSNMTTVHTLAYKDRPSREAVKLKNLYFEDSFHTMFNDSKGYPNAAFMASSKDEPGKVANVIMVIEDVKRGDVDGVIIYHVSQFDAQREASLALPGVTEYVGCGLDIDEVKTFGSHTILSRLEKIECFRGEGAFAHRGRFKLSCYDCCTECKPITVFEHGKYWDEKFGLGQGPVVELDSGRETCVCLDLGPFFGDDWKPNLAETREERTISLTDKSDCMRHRGGSHDIIHGYGGDDVILSMYSPGTEIFGDDGNDVISQFDGDTPLLVGGSDDPVIIRGNAGDDVLWIQGSNGQVFGGAGNDYLRGFHVDPNKEGLHLDGGDGDDAIRVDSPITASGVVKSVLVGGAGTDKCVDDSDGNDNTIECEYCLRENGSPPGCPRADVNNQICLHDPVCDYEHGPCPCDCGVELFGQCTCEKEKIYCDYGKNGNGGQGFRADHSCDGLGEDDCVIPIGLTKTVCRHNKCQNGRARSSPSADDAASCGITNDCIVMPGMSRAVCRLEFNDGTPRGCNGQNAGDSCEGTCQGGTTGEYCGINDDCLGYCVNNHCFS